MIQQLSAWLIVGASLFGLSPFQSQAHWQQHDFSMFNELSFKKDLAFAQTTSDNTAPHRGSGRCESEC